MHARGPTTPHFVQGAEVFNSYGRRDNHHLLVYYGTCVSVCFRGLSHADALGDGTVTMALHTGFTLVNNEWDVFWLKFRVRTEV